MQTETPQRMARRGLARFQPKLGFAAPASKAKLICLAVALLLGAVGTAFSQPSITNQPVWQTNLVGATATFSVGATGTPPLSYQWRKASSAMAGRTNSTLILTNVQVTDQANYSVEVTNFEGSVTSNPARLYVFTPPTVTLQSTNLPFVSIGADVQILVSGTTTHPPLRYQWRWGAIDLQGQTNAALNLTNVQPAAAGDYDAVAADSVGSVTSKVAHLEVDPTFTKITLGNIVTNVGISLSCAWGDYDGDGFVDLIITGAADTSNHIAQVNLLYHNNGDGTFTLVTNSTISAEARDWRGCSWVDYDNDGYLDLYITSSDANGFPSQNELFRNNGDGTFTKMTISSVGDIVSLAAGRSEGAVWADYNHTGFVDLYVARYGQDWLFRNNGDGTFTQITNTAAGLLHDDRDRTTAVWGDYNGDGWPDLLVTISSENGLDQTNLLYLNQANGTFTRIVQGAIAADNDYSIGCAWGDYDNNGYPDLFVANGLNSPATNALYRNNGDGTFTKMTSNIVGSIASDLAQFTQCSWGDFDNDGYLDLLVTSDGPNAVNYLYHNNGDGTFTRVILGSVGTDAGFAYGCAWGDFDNDGFLDLFVARGGATPSVNLLYRNNGNSNGWLKVKLVGTVSNRSGIGAKVRVQATIRGMTMWQMREINTGNGFCANPLEADFGLGDATNIDRVRIEWPSGIVQTMTNVPPRQMLTITEPPRLLAGASGGPAPFSLKGGRGFQYDIQASTNLTAWSRLTTLTITNLNGTAQVADTNAAAIGRRFYRAVWH